MQTIERTDPFLPAFDAPSSNAEDDIFIPSSWHALAQQLNHLAQFGGGIHVVNGVDGAGKSTFSQILLKQMGEAVEKWFVELRDGDDAARVIEKLMLGLGIDPSSTPTVGAAVVQLRQYVQKLRQHQQREIVVIDNAHHIDDGLLAALVSILQGSDEGGFGLNVIFLSRPGLAERIDALGLVDVSVNDSDLPSMGVSELYELFQKQFQKQFQLENFDSVFMQADIMAILKASDGLPGPALAIGSDHLEERIVNLTNRKVGDDDDDKPFPLLHLVVISVLMIGLVAYVIFSYFLPSSPVDLEAEPDQGVAVGTVTDPMSGLIEPSNDGVDLSSVDSQTTDSTPEAVVDHQSEVLGGDILDDNKLNESDPLEAETLQSVDLESDIVAAPDELSEDNASGLSTHTNSLEQESDVTEENKDISTQVDMSTDIDRSVQAEASPVDLGLKMVSSETVVASENYLRSLSAQGYVLQLMAASSEKPLRTFVEQQKNAGNLHIYRGLREGRAWFIVVEGFYADRGSALAAIYNLPRSQQRNRPWPKPVSAVHAEIAAYQSR